MSVETKLKNQIHQLIDALPPERLPQLLQFLRGLRQGAKADIQPSVAPLYQIHEQAVDTGITDLAANHDHYLYGIDSDNE